MITSDVIQAAWKKVANDFDYNLCFPRFKDYYENSSWNDEHFSKLKCHIEKHFFCYQDFYEGHDYAWATDRASYGFMPEPYYQISILDTLLGNWIQYKGIKETEPCFDNVCARETTVWGLQRALPRVVRHDLLKFVIIPYGWDDAANFVAAGLLGSIDLVAILNEKKTRQQPIINDFSHAHPFWRAILIRAIIGNNKGRQEEFYWPEYAEKITNTLHCFNETPLYPDSSNNENQLWLAQMSVAFAIAHEVGHLLDSRLKLDSSSDELSADYLAFQGLWNCNTAAQAFFKFNHNPRFHCIIGAVLFFTTALIVQYARAHFTLPIESRSSVVALRDFLKLRFQRMIEIISVVLNNISDCNSYFHNIPTVISLCVAYSNAFCEFVDGFSQDALALSIARINEIKIAHGKLPH